MDQGGYDQQQQGGGNRGRGGRGNRRGGRFKKPHFNNRPQQMDDDGNTYQSQQHDTPYGGHQQQHYGRPQQQQQQQGGSIRFNADPITNFLQRRLANGVLNLTNLDQDADLMRSVHTSITATLNDPNFGNAFFAYIGGKIGPNVQNVDLSNNNLTTLEGISRLGDFRKYPNLSGLHAKNNLIANLQELQHLKRMNKLKDVSFVNNPMTTIPNYKSEVQGLFPNLVQIDGEAIAQIAFPVQKLTVNLPKSQGMYFDDPSRAVVQAFVQKYFAFFDSNRKELLNVYDQHACFSMTVGPSQSYAERQSIESKEDLQNMTNMSRNLNVVSDAKSRQELLQSSNINVIHHLMKMPQTKHNFAELFVDSHMLAVPVLGQAKQYIVVTCHGAYDVPGFKRSFDRVFILDAATPEVKQKGWDVRILNDQLHVRPYGKFDVTLFQMSPEELEAKWNAEHAKPSYNQQQQQQQPQQPQQQSVPEGLKGVLAQVAQPVQLTQQQVAIQQLCNETKLKPEFAIKCLEASQYNYSGAMSMFMQLRSQGKIPPQYFNM